MHLMQKRPQRFVKLLLKQLPCCSLPIPMFVRTNASLCSAIDAWKGHHDANTRSKGARKVGCQHRTWPFHRSGKARATIKASRNKPWKDLQRKSKNNKRLVMQSKNIGRMLKRSFNRHERLSKSKVEACFEGLKENPWVDSGNAAERP